MSFDFDPEENAINRSSFAARHRARYVCRFDGEPIVLIDDRADYGKIRYRALGRIGGLDYMIVFVVRDETMRLIGFRRAREKGVGTRSGLADQTVLARA